jgi:DNA-binding NtrC family response regulator
MTSKTSASDKTTVLASNQYRNLFQSHSIKVGARSLICTTGPHRGLEIPLNKEILALGRAEWCDIALPQDPLVSRHHCDILLTSDGIRIQDLQSNNGTFVNETQVFEAPLHHSFRIGGSTFVLQAGEAETQVKIPWYDQSGLLVGKSRSMRKLFSMLTRLGKSDLSVLLLGETGTGKSTVARALHEQSQRENGPFVTVNCGALSPSLIEASLFGYEKGAFTGADRKHLGFFEQAHKGTLFLDEIGELPLELQPKLLDVLERKRLHRLGGKQEIEVDFRLITATLSNLEEHLEQKLFREDLYYRLAVAELEVPPLRERLDDIPLLVDYILHNLDSKQTPALAPDALERLCQEHWPGNVRQLRNVLERTLVFLDGPVIGEEDLSFSRRQADSSTKQGHLAHLVQTTGTLKERLQAEERRILLHVLQEHDWNIADVLDELDISRSSLYNRMQKLNIKR